jgi:hypothetical protein
MLVDQLGLCVPSQEQAEIIEPGNNALQLDSVHQEDRDGYLLLADVIEKRIL